MDIQIDLEKYIHGKNLKSYLSKSKYASKKSGFENVFKEYLQFRYKVDLIESLEESDVKNMVEALNNYRKVAIPFFDSLDNAGQQALGYTIMEEFFYILFSHLLRKQNVNFDNLFLGKGNSYVSLSFAPHSFNEVFNSPKPYIHTKDQDFVLGVSIEINVVSNGTTETENTIIPIVAIECKTYLERNMLDSCAATASRLKTAMPYCIYIVASEYMKMADATPELTDIDEVYILCRAKNSDRLARQASNEAPHDIDVELIIDLYKRVLRHLNAIWWNPENAVEQGKIICRPV